MVERISI